MALFLEEHSDKAFQNISQSYVIEGIHGTFGYDREGGAIRELFRVFSNFILLFFKKTEARNAASVAPFLKV